MNKRGQFYLIAAVIIVAVLIGYVSVTNYVSSNEELDDIKLYELSQDLKLEGEYVINHGIFKSKDLNLTLENFTTDYGEYISDQETDVYFIYGGEETLYIVGYLNLETGSIDLQIGSAQPTITISGTIIERRALTDEELGVNPETGELENPNILVKIGDTQYSFDINEGENFFFIIRQPSGIGGASS